MDKAEDILRELVDAVEKVVGDPDEKNRPGLCDIHVAGADVNAVKEIIASYRASESGQTKQPDHG